MEAKKPRKITPEEVEEIRRRFSEQMDQMVQNLNRGALAAAEAQATDSKPKRHLSEQQD